VFPTLHAAACPRLRRPSPQRARCTPVMAVDDVRRAEMLSLPTNAVLGGARRRDDRSSKLPLPASGTYLRRTGRTSYWRGAAVAAAPCAQRSSLTLSRGASVGRAEGRSGGDLAKTQASGPQRLPSSIASSGRARRNPQNAPMPARVCSWVPLPIMTWSWTQMSSSFPASTSWRVSRRSSRLGVASPLG